MEFGKPNVPIKDGTDIVISGRSNANRLALIEVNGIG